MFILGELLSRADVCTRLGIPWSERAVVRSASEDGYAILIHENDPTYVNILDSSRRELTMQGRDDVHGELIEQQNTLIRLFFRFNGQATLRYLGRVRFVRLAAWGTPANPARIFDLLEYGGSELSQREIGRRFRRAVEQELGRTGRVASDPNGDWIVYNGTRVALRYSRCEARGVRSKWFYGIVKHDSEHLLADGALALIMPHPNGHRFALFDQEQTKELLSRCRGSERGDLKIHVRYDDPLDTYRVREWRDLDLTPKVFDLGEQPMEAAGITATMGVAFFSGDEPADQVGEETDGEPDDHQDRWRAPAAAEPCRSTKPAIRTPRRFDPHRVPTLKGRGRLVDPEVALAKREKASQAHQRLVKALDTHLRAAGWTEIAELPGAIDLWARRPIDHRRAIFECKSLSLDRPAAELSRCRTGLAQLLEYRFEYGDPSDALCLVTDGRVSERRLRFLESVGVACLAFCEGSIEFLGDRARALVSGAS